MTHVVVIGAGQAGASLVARLRAEGHDGPITLLGSEAAIPYQRPPLSKAYLLGEMDEDRLSLRSAAWYADNAITLRTGTTVTAIDPAGRTVALADGTTLAYDALALTTGSRARRLPAAIGGDLDGVLTMRDRADADRMAPRLIPGARVLIIGGGYIGLEAAAVCATRGLRVTLIEMAPRILQRVAAPQTSDWFRALHRSHGVDIRDSTGLDRLIGDSRVTAARLADGTELAVDFALVGVGILPNAELAAAAGLATDNGIVTDSHCRTSDPHIWAAGDCATLDWHGTRIRLESVGNAIDQAECAALNILGRATPYVPQPWFWSDQYDCKLQIAGLNLGYDSVHVRLTDASSRSHWYYRGDRLIAVDAINDSRAYMIGKRLIEMGKSPPPAVVTDPATDLKPLLRA